MRRLDELFTAWPFLGSRQMAAMLRAGDMRRPQTGAAADAADGYRADLGPEAAHDETARRAQDLPYLLRNLVIDRPNHVWAQTSPMSRSGGGFSIWWR